MLTYCIAYGETGSHAQVPLEGKHGHVSLKKDPSKPLWTSWVPKIGLQAWCTTSLAEFSEICPQVVGMFLRMRQAPQGTGNPTVHIFDDGQPSLRESELLKEVEDLKKSALLADQNLPDIEDVLKMTDKAPTKRLRFSDIADVLKCHPQKLRDKLKADERVDFTSPGGFVARKIIIPPDPPTSP